jgi:[amino group carrier protein]-L-2-aminoadipate 6-kinase
MTLANILVVKLGGGEGLDLAASCDDLAQITQQRPLVVVHGVSAIMNQMCTDLGVEVQSLTSPSGHSSRYTTPEVRDIFVRASELANERVVSALRQRGVNAVSVIGDDVVVNGTRKKAIRAVVNGRVRVVRDDHSGSIQDVTTQKLIDILEQGQIPVLPPVANSDDGLLNVDGDRASAAVAGALNAEELLILSNVRGLYRNFPDEESFVSEVSRSQMDNALNWAEGRMKRKVLGAQEALDGGVSRVIIGDGRITNPASEALAGAGTVFTA